MFKRFIVEYKNSGLVGVLRRLAYYIPNHLTIFWVRKSQNINRVYDRGGEQKVIVSLTSFPPRFKNIHICLKSLLLQSYEPDRLIVYLGSDSNRSMLTDEMLELEKYGIEYVFDSTMNLMPHKKYFYAMKEYPEAVIITVDDDSVYGPWVLKSLMECHRKYPDSVCARRVHKIKWRDSGEPDIYRNWTKECRSVITPSEELVAVGVGGVLYPPHCLSPDAFDVDKISSLALRVDDLWLKCMEMKKGTKVKWVNCLLPHPASLEGIASLNDENVTEARNDQCVLMLNKEYKAIKRKS